MTKFLKNHYLFLTILVVVLLTFWKLPQTFYQQDEWQALGHNLAEGAANITSNLSLARLLTAQGRPLARALNLLFFGFFKFDLVPAAIFNIAIHCFNAFLIFFLIQQLSQKNLVALLASLFFIVNSISHQAVTWVAAMATLPATTFILLSLLAYFRFLKQEKKNWLYLSFGLAVLSLFFKEAGIFLFILLPIIFLLFRKKATLKELFDIHLPLFIYGGMMLSFRMGGLFFRTKPVAGFVKGGGNFISAVAFHLILYPLTSLFQVFVPPRDLYRLTPMLTKIQYKFLIGSPLINLAAQSVVADLVAVIGSLLILFSLVLLVNKVGNQRIKRNILFALAFFLLSFLPYTVLHRESSYLSSRYFYVGATGAGMIFGYILFFLTKVNEYFRWAVLSLAVIYLFHQMSIVRSDINYQVNLGKERMMVLKAIKKDSPQIDKDNIFYFTSNKGFYGTITNPFQNGLGYVLEVWYYDSGNIPKEFLKDNFLWDLGSEGYRSLGGRGFGYFQDLGKMAETMKEKQLSSSIIHAYFYDAKNKQITNNTERVKEEIATFGAQLK